jgi:hypothetical protein
MECNRSVIWNVVGKRTFLNAKFVCQAVAAESGAGPLSCLYTKYISS